jgi:hypothetical protein
MSDLAERCRELADYAVQDRPRLRGRAGELARNIEDTVETWLAATTDAIRSGGTTATEKSE